MTLPVSRGLRWRRERVAGIGGIERRTLAGLPIELRSAPDGSRTLTGYASVTGKPYEVGFYTEVIQRGAFKRTLGEDPDVQLLINHAGLPLARTKSGTLRLSEDDHGLRIEADLDPDDPDVESLARKMSRGDVDEMSFAFRVTDQDWNDDFTRRLIKAVTIHRGDVSIVNYGANPATSASLRSSATPTARTSPLPPGSFANADLHRMKEEIDLDGLGIDLRSRRRP